MQKPAPADVYRAPAPLTHRRKPRRQKLIIPPSVGKCGPWVYYRRGRTQCRRRLVLPHNPRSNAQLLQRAHYSRVAKTWRELPPHVREAWNIVAALERTRPRLGLDAALLGQLLFQKVNVPTLTIGKELLLWPPAQIIFSRHPACELSVTHGSHGVRLKLRLAAPLEHDLVVSGQAPCSARRNKWRHGAYLDVWPEHTSGEIDITDWYVRQFGQPEPGKKVFIRTRLQRNGRQSQPQDTSHVVPARVVAAGRRLDAGRWGFILHPSSFILPRLRHCYGSVTQPLRNRSLVHRTCPPPRRKAHHRQLWRGT